MAAGTRHYSNDSPPENISRYPVPYKKDLPYDIVELMEEVESKVKTIANINAMASLVYMLNLMCPYREAFCPMSSKCFPIDQQSSEPSSLTTMNL